MWFFFWVKKSTLVTTYPRLDFTWLFSVVALFMLVPSTLEFRQSR